MNRKERQRMAENVSEQQRTTARASEAARALAETVDHGINLYHGIPLEGGLPLWLPFHDYFAKVVRYSRTFHLLREGDDDKKWQSPSFLLMRLVKAHESKSDATGSEAFVHVDRLLHMWYGDAENDLSGWEALFGDSWTREDAQFEFVDAWDRVRFIPGMTIIENALMHAERFPMNLPPDDDRPEVYARFLVLAGWLQVVCGDKNICLPVELVGRTLGVSSMTITRCRRHAEKAGFLMPMKKSRRPAGGKRGDATEFRFNLAAFPHMQTLAKPGSGSVSTLALAA